MGVVSVFLSVLASFRGTVQHGLPLEIGDTVQILEKCEGTVSLELFFLSREQNEARLNGGRARVPPHFLSEAQPE